MANTITLFKQYITNTLDLVYKQNSLTSMLDGNADLVQAGANANELVIPMISMQGLGAYNRNSGYVRGDASMTNETVKCNFDRGRKFTVDAMDNIETAGMAFGRLGGEFVRTKVNPEQDAFRFASYAGKAGISQVAAGADLADGAAVITALRAATNKMDEDEVPYEGRHLFITPTLYGMIQDLDTTKSKEVLSRFVFDPIRQQVPQTRFYTAITQKDGTTVGEEAGGYVKADGAKNINFMILHNEALIQFPKHIAPKVLPPEVNPDGDGWMFGYRLVSIADVYANKLAGVYLHYATV